MAKQLLDTGSVANDNTGDTLRQAGGKLNSNFNELYNALGNGVELLSADINLANYKILFANKVADLNELQNISSTDYAGCVIYVESEASLYYAANGRWRELLTDTSDNIDSNYTDPLSAVAYSGNLTDLGIDDGTNGQVLIANGDRTFTFSNVEALNPNATALNGQPGSFYLNFNNFTNLPSTLAGHGITDAATSDQGALADSAVQPGDLAAVATSNSYNDLNNLPEIPADISELTDINNALKEDLSEFSDDGNLLFSGDYSDLSNPPSIPQSGVDFDPAGTDNSVDVTLSGTASYLTIDGQNITLNQIDASTDITGLATVATSGSYADLTGSPTALGFSSGVTINEFSNDSTLSDNSTSAVPTESAVKTYVDEAISSFDTVGNFTFGTGTITTEDSSGIEIIPAVTAQSDLIVENDLTVNNLLSVNNLNVTGTIETTGAGTPELYSDDVILLTASTRVEVTQTPFKMASFTTAERDNLTPENGDTIYNTSTNKFQGYAGGSWVDLH